MDPEYQPNFSNGHVRKRANNVLTWAAQFLIGKYGTDVPLHLSAKGYTDGFGVNVPGLNDVFGPKGNPLGDYLRAALLIPVSRSYKPGDHSMTYRLSRDGYERIEASLNGAGKTGSTNAAPPEPTQTPLDRMIQRHGSELHELAFQYKDKSSRLWHPLQNLRRAEKHAFWSRFGLPFDYDIEACAPTILFQLARQAGLPAILLETLQRYLDDRQGFRAHVSTLTGLSDHQAKQLVNSLFNGARLGKNTQFSAFRLLDFRDEAMDALKADPQVQRLVKEIARVWRRIESDRALHMRLPVDVASTSTGELDRSTPWKLKTSRQKWTVYFVQERRVLDAITTFLAGRDIRVFTEHDGFRTSARIETGELEAYILRVTGFEMKIDGPTSEESAL